MRTVAAGVFLAWGIVFAVGAAEKTVLQPMSEFDGITKDELIKQREKKMIYSAFYRYDYSPRIFGQMHDSEKWIGERASCYRNEFYDGKSEASIWVNNPNVLVHLSLDAKYGMYYGNTYNPVFCMYAKQLLFRPKSLIYDEEKKEITAFYKGYNVLVGIGSHTHGALKISLSAINAYDVGFNFINLAEHGGIVFDTEKGGIPLVQATEKVTVIYTGVSHCEQCYEQQPGACACYRKVDDWQIKLTSKRAEMLFKLWKEKPKSKSEAADFYYRIKFTE